MWFRRIEDLDEIEEASDEKPEAQETSSIPTTAYSAAGAGLSARLTTVKRKCHVSNVFGCCNNLRILL
jgi:hypothetical protein